jgi:malate synthase
MNQISRVMMTLIDGAQLRPTSQIHPVSRTCNTANRQGTNNKQNKRATNIDVDVLCERNNDNGLWIMVGDIVSDGLEANNILGKYLCYIMNNIHSIYTLV